MQERQFPRDPDASEGVAAQNAVPRSLWNERRVRLSDALRQHSDLFADLYGRAIDALSEEPPVSHGALVVAAHCIRDLVNGLPDVLTDVEAVPARSDTSRPERNLLAAWKRNVDVLGPVDNAIMSSPATEGETEPRMTVPVSVVESARRVAAATNEGTLNARRRQSALVLGHIELRNDATVDLFRNSIQVFEEIRHPGRGRDIVVDEVLTRVPGALEVIEGVLESRMINFFETVDDLRDLLEAANQRDEEN